MSRVSTCRRKSLKRCFHGPHGPLGTCGVSRATDVTNMIRMIYSVTSFNNDISRLKDMNDEQHVRRNFSRLMTTSPGRTCQAWYRCIQRQLEYKDLCILIKESSWSRINIVDWLQTDWSPTMFSPQSRQRGDQNHMNQYLKIEKDNHDPHGHIRGCDVSGVRTVRDERREQHGLLLCLTTLNDDI